MATVFDVAKYILHKLGKMSTWKLQKLCYYAQAWTLAWDGEPLFDEDFQAWANGPVCPELYNQHKGRFMVDDDNISLGDKDKLDENQANNVDVVLDDYGDKEAWWLREQTHNEAPWLDMRVGMADGESCNKIITKDAMGEYYGSL